MKALIALDGLVYSAVPVGEGNRGCLNDDGTCCGCRMPTGREHNRGCDWESCPRCGAQAICCDCADDEMPRYTAAEARVLIERLSSVVWAESL